MPAVATRKKAPLQAPDPAASDVQQGSQADQAMDAQGPAVPTSVIDLTTDEAMGTGNASQQAHPVVANNQGHAPQTPDTGEQQVHAYLSQRFVSCRGPAVQAMRVRPALARLQTELSGALCAMVRDTTSLSVLVLGDPGSGKTLLVERAVASACAAHNGDGSVANRVVGVVRLHGLLHLEERAAFQEMARQLCSEFGQDFSKTATFDENLAFLRNMLATLHHNLKAVVFVIDYFEKFARARGKQQLLYNLFDVLQHSQVQAAVIGVTCAQDVMESMEKRVRSRFSHRRMLLTGFSHFEVPTAAPAGAPTAPATSAARRADADAPPITFLDTPSGVLQDVLTIPAAAPAAASQPASRTGEGTSSGGAAGGATVAAGCPSVSSEYCGQFNTAVAAAVRDERVKAALQQLFVEGLKPRALMAAAHAALDAWQEESAAGAGGAVPVLLRPAHLVAGISSQLAVPPVRQVHDLSVLQLYMVVGMMRLEAKGQVTYNFEMVWDECQSFRGTKGVLGALTHGAAWRAFEELVAANIAYWISPGAEAAGRAMRYAGVSLALSKADVVKALEHHEQCPGDLIKFLNS